MVERALDSHGNVLQPIQSRKISNERRQLSEHMKMNLRENEDDLGEISSWFQGDSNAISEYF